MSKVFERIICSQVYSYIQQYVVYRLIDLSKAYDYLPHGLIIVKLEVYGFNSISLKLLHLYFSNRKKLVKIGSAISEWIDILTGIPQGSILGPLIFSISINDLIMFIEKI